MDLDQKREKFTQEYSDLFEYLYRYVSVRLGHRHDAEDLVSDIFIKSYTRLADYEPDKGSLRQWLTGIAKNEILMHWRRKRPLVSLEITDDVMGSAHDPHPSQLVDNQMLAEKIFSSLPPATKALVALRYVEDLSYEELSDMTGKQVPALRQFFSRLHRALRLEFSEMYDEPTTL